MKKKDVRFIQDLTIFLILVLGIVTKSFYLGIILTILAFLIYFGYQIFKRRQFYKNQQSMEKIDKMNGVEFEQFMIRIILPKMGYTKLKPTPTTNDYGVDIIGYKNDIKCAIQCKRYNNKVSNKAIQEIVAGKNHYLCDKAIVITNNYYTKNAKELAFDNKVELIDRDDLILAIKSNKS